MQTLGRGLLSSKTKRALAILVSASLSLVGVTAMSPPANAGTNVDVFYSGNTIGTGVPVGITVDRDVIPLPPAASVTGSRTGYSFGGWSLVSGGPALAGSSLALTNTATRLDLFAVWNTTILYNTNGATSGSLVNSKTSDTYRFGQTIDLPGAGTLSRTGFAFGGWMSASLGTVRFATYSASSSELGNPTLFASWIKTVSFNANSATIGTTPISQTMIAGSNGFRLPTISDMTLRKPGFDFLGWSTTATGSVISNPGSYTPAASQETLFAIWRVQSSKATTRVFFNPGKSTLRASQKLLLRDLVDTMRGKTSIRLALTATYPRSAARSLGKARNTAVVNYLKTLGVVATYDRSNELGRGVQSAAKKNNRVSLGASWVNPN